MCVFIYTYTQFFSIYKWSHTLFYNVFFFNQEFIFDVSMEDFSTLIPYIVFHCLAFIYGINDLLLRFVR